jgi:single-stranded-DNA-specific exonuclease
MTAEDYEPKLKLDGTLQASDVTLDLIQELSRLEPYGMGNSRPVFALRHMRISDKWKMGQDKKHLRLTVADAQGITVKGVGWSMAEEYDDLAEGDEADLAFQLELNEYQGNTTPQMVVQDIHADTERPVLDRETMVTVYRTLRQFVPEKGLSVAIARQKLADLLAGTYDAHTVRAALQVLLEIGVLAAWKTPSESVLYFPQLAGKMQLETSPTYKKYGQA